MNFVCVIFLVPLVAGTISRFNSNFIHGNGGWFSNNEQKSSENSNGDRTTITNWYQNNIQLYDARIVSEGRSNVVVGVIDTGIDSSHSLLSSNYNSSLSTTFSPNLPQVPNPTSGYEHGTMVSGIISPSFDSNGDYVTGICSKVKLASIRADGPPPSYRETYSTIYNAINYAKNNNFSIVNYSGGFEGDELSPTQRNNLKNLINSFDGLLIVSAGNNEDNHENNDHTFFQKLDESAIYPSCFDCDNLIVVGASTSSNLPWYKSAISQTHVDLFAPGDDIRSTTFSNNYLTGDGTSLAAPMVTGTAALIKSINPLLTTSEIKEIILNNTDYNPNFALHCVTGGKLNVFKSVLDAIPLYSSMGNAMLSPNLVNNGDDQWFKVNLTKNNIYSFSVTNSYTSGELYNNVTSSPVAVSAPSGSNSFSISYECTSNRTVYIRIQNNGTIPLINNPAILYFSGSITHSHVPLYLYVSESQHRMRCKTCGEIRYEGHTINATTGQCLECLAYINGYLYDSIGGSNKSDDNRVYFGEGSYLLNGITVLSEPDVIRYLNNELVIPCHDNEEGACHNE